MKGNRNITFDMMKGIGILLVIIGHLAHGYGLSPIIYVFHMPLFFIVSGYFYKPKQPLVLFKRDVKLLLLPYALVAFFILLYGAIIALVNHDVSKFTYWCSSAMNVRLPEASVGPLWFMLAMFWCRMVYNLLNIYLLKNVVKREKILLEVVISLLVFVVTIKCVPVKYNFCCFVVGLSSMFFYMIGHVAKLADLHISKISSVLFVLLGFYCLYLSYDDVEMAGMRYDCLPVNVFAAVSVTYFIYLLCARYKDLKIGKGLAWLGRFSIAVFCIHTLMYRVVPLDRVTKIFIPSGNELFISGSVTLLHIVLSILFCLFVERVRIMRAVFSIK